MSKPVKELVRRALVQRFTGMTSLAVVGFTGLDAVVTAEIRRRLNEKGIRLMVVKNALARQAFQTVGLDAAAGLLDGPCAIASGGDSVVMIIRELLTIREEAPELTVKAAVLEGEAFGPERIEELSKYPTREEAVMKLAACLLAPAGRLSACLFAPGRRVAALVKAIGEKQSGEDQGADDTGGEPEPSGGAAPAESAEAKTQEE